MDSMKWAAAEHIAKACRFRLGLSATPIYNYGGEIYSILQVLAPGQIGEALEFGTEWCGGEFHDKAKITDPKALGSYLRDCGLMLRRTRKDVGRELPEVQRIPHHIGDQPFGTSPARRGTAASQASHGFLWAYNVTYGEKGNGAGFSAKTFCDYIGLDYTSSRSLPAAWNDDYTVLEAEVPAEFLKGAAQNAVSNKVTKMEANKKGYA